ncbi:hypothetical protein D9M68_721960 [compost metagenome]
MAAKSAVYFGHRVEEAQAVAQAADIGGNPGQEQPALLCAISVGVGLERRWRIQFRLQGDRVHENIAAQALTEQSLQLAQVGGHGRAVARAVDVHHVDGDHFAAYQVIVEAHLAPVLGLQQHVGERRVGRLADSEAVRGAVGNGVADGAAHGGKPETAEEFASSVHERSPWFGVSLLVMPLPLPLFGDGPPLSSTMSQRPIMAWSSWIMLWQWIGYLPRKSRKRRKIRSVTFSPTT